MQETGPGHESKAGDGLCDRLPATGLRVDDEGELRQKTVGRLVDVRRPQGICRSTLSDHPMEKT